MVKAHTFNDTQGITGLLVFDDGCFLQVIEGPDEAIVQLYDRIEHDKRHYHTKIISNQLHKRKEFKEWSMGFVDIDHKASALKGFIEYKSLKDMPADKSVAKIILLKFQEKFWRDKGNW